jgi:hypothetical protein
MAEIATMFIMKPVTRCENRPYSIVNKSKRAKVAVILLLPV